MKIRLLILTIFVMSLSSCGQEMPVRNYEEITIDSPLRAAKMPDRMELPQGHPSVSDLQNGMDMSAQSETTKQMLESSIAQVALTWKTPEGWVEEKGSGIRLATFKTIGENPIECSIISLSGVAGGLDANITRWLGQIGINDISKEEREKILNQFLVIEAVDKLKFMVIDLTGFSASPDAPAIFGAVLQDLEKTIFVKMTGSKEALLSQRKNFESLCRSFAMNHE
jgi:hypothetical protein